MSNGKPKFHQISRMPLLEEEINDILLASEEQLSTLNKVVDRPYILDNFTVNRIIKAFSEQKEYLELYEKQFCLWQKVRMDARQKEKLEGMQQKLNAVKILNIKILALTEQFRSKTIEKIMEKDDLELAIDFLLKN